MKIDNGIRTIKIRDLFEGYKKLSEIKEEEEVLAWNGNLIVRPAYQREFIYNPEKQQKVIESVIQEFPLNTIFLVNVESNNGKYEVLDGQQRILSICQFLADVNSFNLEGIFNGTKMNATNLKQSLPATYNKIMDYELDVRICIGDNEEKLKWFKVINTAGEKLNEQELRNAAYTGTWLTEAKKYFGLSKNGCRALIEPMRNGCKIVELDDAKAGRQKVLELALEWKSSFDFMTNKEICDIESYMNKYRNESNANDLIDHWNKVVSWVLDIFGYKNSSYLFAKELKSVNKKWGNIYNISYNKNFNFVDIQGDVEKWMNDDEITKKPGIFPYVLTNDEKYLSFRAFDKTMRKKKFLEQKGVCPGVKERKCGKTFKFEEMEGDHIKPWSKGGKTVYENLQMLCIDCNRVKTNK
jgi:hypothetical protein